MRKWVGAMLLTTLSWASALAEERVIPAPPQQPLTWASQPPQDCPFPRSEPLTGVAFTGRQRRYTNADTWYPSWASDGKMYSPFADGRVDEFYTMWNEKTTGQARIEGDDPLNLTVTPPGLTQAAPAPYGGRCPCGTLVHNGICYYGYYALKDLDGMNWTVQGPLVGFRLSRDFGQTWQLPPHTPAKPLFGQSSLEGQPVKIGAPHFVDFGQNMEHSPDGYAYLVAHGAARPDPQPRKVNLNWIVADQIYMIRVKPTPQTIKDPAAYEFFAGHNEQGQPVWSKAFAELKPLIDWNNNCGCVTMTWNPALRKYLTCITDGKETIHSMNTYILESDTLTGPFRLVSYMKDFGPQAYFVNFPSRFIGADGRSVWLCYAANFTPQTLPVNPKGSGYGMCLQEVKLLPYDFKTTERNQLAGPENLARQAAVQTSSTHDDYHSRGVNDGLVDGWPGDIQREWASQGEKEGAWVRLEWTAPVTIGRVQFFDRPNPFDQITEGLLEFSDGSSTRIKTPLADDAATGVEVSFAPRKITWLRYRVQAVRSGAQNIGLSEIAVFPPVLAEQK